MGFAHAGTVASRSYWDLIALRVILCIHSLRAGGAERVMSWLANSLESAGHQVTLVVRTPPTVDFFEINEGVRIVRLVRKPRKPGRVSRVDKVRGVIGFGRELRALVKEVRPDVVVSFIDMTNLYVLAALKGTGTSVIVSERIHPDFHELGTLDRLRPRLYRGAAAVVVQSDDVARIARQQWGVGRVVVIPNPAAAAATAAMPVDQRPMHAISVGRLTKQKDHATLLGAWAAAGVARRGWNLSIYGAGNEEQSLRGMISNLELEDGVHIVDPVAEIDERLALSRIFILPSRYEGFPNALIEAMAAGCACIATDCPGASAEILEHGAAGILVPPGDVLALTAAIVRLTDSPDEQVRLAAASNARAHQFREPVVVEMWERTLREAADRGVAA